MDSFAVLDDIKLKLTQIDDKLNNTICWIGIKEAAAYSGLSKSTLRRAVRRGSLKCSRRAGKLLFKRADVDRWLDG